MHDEHPHPLLAQVPLTLSPFLSLPTSVPLPYSYKTLPSTLPPSILSAPNNQSATSDATSRTDSPGMSSAQNQQSQAPHQPAYVVSASGTAASPDAILSSCVALQTHLQKLEDDARRVLGDWEAKRKAEDLAEKRRVAPGWLDSGVHILRPENVVEEKGAASSSSSSSAQQGGAQKMDYTMQSEKDREGEELDRVFGGLKM